MRALTHVYIDSYDDLETNALDGVITVGSLTDHNTGVVWIVFPGRLEDRIIVIDRLLETLNALRGNALLRMVVSSEDDTNRRNVRTAAAYISDVADKSDIEAVEDAIDAYDLGVLAE